MAKAGGRRGATTYVSVVLFSTGELGHNLEAQTRPPKAESRLKAAGSEPWMMIEMSY